MSLHSAIWPTPAAHIVSETPDHPMLYFAPSVLRRTVARFESGFPGLVSYAVKANDARMVLENLAAAGVSVFDVASPAEMRKVRAVLPAAVLHYNNPVRSRAELRAAREIGVASYAVDSHSELDKLAAEIAPRGIEVAVRLKLPVPGAAYDFGGKFGADAALCRDLLRRVAALDFVPAMTFHPGTQCADPAAWEAYIRAVAAITRAAGVTIGRLNVGGGFAAHRTGPAPDLERIFARIGQGVAAAFDDRPGLVCEPGRAMVADAFTLGTRVKAVRDGASVFLNDGIYGGLAEAPVLGTVDRLRVIAPDGRRRTGAPVARAVFGPTCDSLDRLPGQLSLPADMAEGDYILFYGMGAYSTATVTRFNGYGEIGITTVHKPF